MEDKQNLVGPLAHWLAAGKLEPRLVLPAIQKLLSEDAQPRSLLWLHETLLGTADETLVALECHVRETLRKEALRVHHKFRRGQSIPDEDRAVLGGLALQIAPEWRIQPDPTTKISAAASTVRDLAFLAANQDKAPRLFREVKLQSTSALAAAHAALNPLFEELTPYLLDLLDKQWKTDLPGREVVLQPLRIRADAARRALLASASAVGGGLKATSDTEDRGLLAAILARFEAGDRTEKERILDLACSWPTPAAFSTLREMTGERWAKNRALLNFTLRFGLPDLTLWEKWLEWVGEQFRLWTSQQDALSRLILSQPEAVLLVLYSQRNDPDPALVDTLVKFVALTLPPINPQALIQNWVQFASLPERRALLGLPEPKPPPIPPLIPHGGGAVQMPPLLRQAEPEAVPAPAVEAAAVPPAPPTPPKPSFWENHLQPLFVENWYIVAGIAMVILGSSVLAYYTWDKHWLLRYTIMPALLAIFTWSLAGVGQWIEKKSSEFKSTAAILRGAAAGLLPINFMAMALMSADEKVPQKAIALLVMACIYLSLFGWSLRKWCAAVEPALGNLLGGTLLLLNSLVAVGPLTQTVGHLEGRPLLLCLGAGFYLGFAATAAVIVRFTRRILTREMAEEKRVPWFVAGALAITYLQVFVWVHGFMRHLPQAHTYALLVIGIGWLILFSERRALELRASPQLHGGESFLGFAFILLGLLMGFGDSGVRIVAFLAAGAVWMYQALSRRHPLHYWIALTLLGLGGASVGLLEEYPGPWLPVLGIILAAGYGLGGWFSRKSDHPDLSKACFGMQVVALVVTTMVAPLTQWHYRSEPFATAGWLLGVAALFAWRSFNDQKIHWLHATMLVMALALPYAGFMDMASRTAHHNTLAFGLAVLSFLWLGLTRLWPRALILQARSTVLWFYGTLAVAAMLLRVALGDTAPAALWYRDYMDYAGPILMMLALIPATYHSRSLVPAMMAVAIMAILFPEMRANLQETLPWLSWGSGLGSSICGLMLVCLSFLLRPWSFLQKLPEGDRFMGKDLFPLRRQDHTLFTWPILAAALFLIVKVDTWNLLTNLLANGVHLKTSVALCITGVAWTFLAIYQREHRGAVAGVHLGWLCALGGINFGYWDRWEKATDPHWSWPFLFTAILLQVLYWIYRYRIELKHPWARSLLTEPIRMVLLAGSGALAIVCIYCLVDGSTLQPMQWLYAFIAAQLIWHALRSRHLVFGTIFFFQVWIALLAVTAPGLGHLWERLAVERNFTPTVWLLLGIQLVFVVLERVGDLKLNNDTPNEPVSTERKPTTLYPLLSALLIPSFGIASTITLLLGLGGILDGLHLLALTQIQQALLLTALLLAARAQISAPYLLVAMLLSYVAIHRHLLTTVGDPEAVLKLLAAPWRLSGLGLAMVLLVQGIVWIKQRKPTLVTGPFALRFFHAPYRGVIFWPALIFAVAAALYHTFDPALRERPAQLCAPYAGAAAFALVAWFWNRSRFFAGAGFLLLLGNIHLVRVFGGDFLRDHGLSELHLICLGIGLTLLQASVLTRTVQKPQAVASINLTSLGLAFLVLVLLSANYFTAPDLAGMKPTRFIVSGALAWLAGQYFRRAARHPGPGEESQVDLCEALYHFGLVMAIWCAALLIPWFRLPMFTLVALGLPAAHFYRRAEMGLRAGEVQARRYRNSAAVLGLVLLGLYVFKAIFQMVLFPGTPIGTQYYHYNAPLIMVLGLMMLRLHGLGATVWLAFYGGLALMMGSYFSLTALPGLSPFDFPIPSAWSAIILGHFWILVSYARSPLRTLIQRIAKLDDTAWESMRHYWGLCLLAATQGSTLWGIADYSMHEMMVAPVLAAAATIVLHQGIIRLVSSKRAGRKGFDYGVLYILIAALELTLALHMDFIIPSYIAKEQIIWVLVVLWVALLVVYQSFTRKIQSELIGRVALALAALIFSHIIYHRPWSPVGLWAMVLVGILAAANPQRTPEPVNHAERLFGRVILWIPTWLVYFSQSRIAIRGLDGSLEPWAVLATTVTIFLTGLFAKMFQRYLAHGYSEAKPSQYRLYDSTLAWLRSAGTLLHRVTLWITLIAVCATQGSYYSTAFASREFVLLILLEAALTVSWFYEGKDRESMLGYYLMQISAAACFASIRRHLMLTTLFWNYEYDVWASLGFSFALAGAKQVFELQPRALRVPLLTSMFMLPVMALVWVVVHGLGVNLALLIVGLHSVMFAYLGKGDRESPYNIVALSGFVAFILMTFYSKLHLQAVHAYVIPVGLGVLILQELFRARIRPDARNWIRLITLMAMLGSSGYYALADPRHAITFNLTMIILCLVAMGLGSFMQIRLYLALGFAGLIADLVSILYKVLVHMDRSARMTIIGSLVLVIGAVLVFGAIYYKTKKAELDAWVEKWRNKLGRWE